MKADLIPAKSLTVNSIVYPFICVCGVGSPEGQYFSEEQMRNREPLLYEQYIGQYLTDDEVRPGCHSLSGS